MSQAVIHFTCTTCQIFLLFMPCQCCSTACLRLRWIPGCPQPGDDAGYIYHALARYWLPGANSTGCSRRPRLIPPQWPVHPKFRLFVLLFSSPLTVAQLWLARP